MLLWACMNIGVKFTQVGGMMPNQAEGTFNGVPFYFRARHGNWQLYVGEPIFEHAPIAEGTGGPSYLFPDHSYRCEPGWWDDHFVKAFVANLLCALR